MQLITILFWVSFFIVFYAFIGYGIVITLLAKTKGKPVTTVPTEWMPVTLVVPCYNEADILSEKISNCFAMDYPKEKLQYMFITDGSTDNSPQIIQGYSNITLLHSSVRSGKSAAENRAMQHVTTPVVIFTDANTSLNTNAIKNIVRHFYDGKVGCVSGEKRVMTASDDGASATEGVYWKYESFLKKRDSDWYTAVGAAGELVAFRTSLYEEMPHDTILDDFIQSMIIASKGYKIVYEPEAYAMEVPSANIKEEIKRKVRICAGGWQSISRLQPRIHFANDARLAFQYYSHRVLRWTVTPFLMIVMFITSGLLSIDGNGFQQSIFVLQALFYASALAGYIAEMNNIKIKLLYVPFYFCMMNWCVIAGLKRYLKKQQSGAWDKAVRKTTIVQS